MQDISHFRLPKLGFVIREEKIGKLLVEKKIRKLAPEPTFLCLFSAPTISELDMNHIDPSSKKLYFRHSKLNGDWCLLWLWCWCKTYLFVQLLVCTFVCCIFVMCSSSLMQLFVFSLFCICFVCCSYLFVRLFVYRNLLLLCLFFLHWEWVWLSAAWPLVLKCTLGHIFLNVLHKFCGWTHTEFKTALWTFWLVRY